MFGGELEWYYLLQWGHAHWRMEIGVRHPSSIRAVPASMGLYAGAHGNIRIHCVDIVGYAASMGPRVRGLWLSKNWWNFTV
jgi:hypothetical protein